MKTTTEIIADGLEAAVDGRGWNEKHEKARRLADGAPKLLKAAKCITSYFCEWAKDYPDDAHRFKELEDAISKAEGR